jgi:hypothetical protein
MSKEIEAHERGHQAAFAFYHVASRIEGPLTIPEPHHLTAEQQLVVLVSGAVNEYLHFPSTLLMNGCGGDAALLCKALHGTNEVAYAAALACIVAGSNARLCIPVEHEQLIREAVREAQTILEGVPQ